MKFKISILLLYVVLQLSLQYIVHGQNCESDLLAPEDTVKEVALHFADVGWNYICSNGLNQYAAIKLCKDNGYTGLREIGSVSVNNTTSNYPISPYRYECDGYESNNTLCDCTVTQQDCETDKIATVECYTPEEGNLRLTDQILEIYYEGSWGYVCDDSFDLKEANVACRTLGFIQAESFTTGNYIENPLEPKINYLYCYGTEQTITDCRYSKAYVSSCSSFEHVQLTCATSMYIYSNTAETIISTISLHEKL
ncbi:hypothetical protein LOD99_14491 [Oopsacas minuta]|uniref:SRCR domain-containing protein n=1 Tax=Oopsacas minuta TaxID=111878 RepID=A0AAV7KEH3_9METZ|nr:hypothetical protein LOD99_14491 [Oopsacas minuta]